MLSKKNPKYKNKNELNKVIEDPLDDSEIKKYLPDAKIYKYNQLCNFDNIDELLPGDRDYVIILYEQMHNTGHWICVLKYGNTLEYFDSYGNNVDEPLQWITVQQNYELKQYDTFIANMFNKTKKERNIIWNPVKYQELQKGINTCGRHVIFRIINMLKGCDIDTYFKRMKHFKKQLGSYDDVVSQFIDVVE